MVLPILVFVAEMCVVTLGTIRIIFVSRGMKYLATILGFCEIMIWLFAIGQIMRNLNNPACFVAFAGGFATGNFLGLYINEKLALGNSVVQIITNKKADELVRKLNLADFGVTCLEGQGATGPVQVIFTIVKRREVGTVTSMVREFDPMAFFAIDEVEMVNQGIFPLSKFPARNRLRGLLAMVGFRERLGGRVKIGCRGKELTS